MTLPTLLAVLAIVVAVPLNWIVTWKLWGVSRAAPEVLVLRERTLSAGWLSLVLTVFALIFLNNQMDVPLLGLEATQIITRSAILSLSLPALVWLWLYRR